MIPCRVCFALRQAGVAFRRIRAQTGIVDLFIEDVPYSAFNLLLCCTDSPSPSAAQVAGRTNDAAGDGTTTAAVLAREMIHYGLQV